MSRSYFYFVPSVIWAIIIFTLSTNTTVEIDPIDWWSFISIDKAGHLVFYSIFCVLVCWGFSKLNMQTSFSTSKLILAICLVIIYGVVMEFLQLKFYEGRQLEFMDMIANAIGAIIGAFIFRKFLYSRL